MTPLPGPFLLLVRDCLPYKPPRSFLKLHFWRGKTGASTTLKRPGRWGDGAKAIGRQEKRVTVG